MNKSSTSIHPIDIAPPMRSSLPGRVQTMKDTHIAPLTPQFFAHLIKLETDFYNKQYTTETLEELTEAYHQAVEYYDCHKDPISSYFVFKIQDVLEKSVKLLTRASLKAKEERDSHTTASTLTPPGSAGLHGSPTESPKYKQDIPMITETLGDESSEDEDEREDKVQAMVARKARLDPTKLVPHTHRKSITALKNKKQRMFTLQMIMQKEKAHERQSLTVVLSSFTDTSQKNDNVIKTDIDIQRDQIRKRVAKRKKDTFMSVTHSSSGFLQAKGGDMTIESVLKGLEDEDSLQKSISNSNNDDGSETREDRKELQSEGSTI